MTAKSTAMTGIRIHPASTMPTTTAMATITNTAAMNAAMSSSPRSGSGVGSSIGSGGGFGGRYARDARTGAGREGRGGRVPVAASAGA